MGSYAEAITGKSASLTLPIGAKSAPPKTPAKYASGAIGAAVPPKGKAKAKAKGQGESAPIGAPSKAKQGTTKGKGPVITSDSALEYLKNAPDDQSFDEYQVAQDTSAQPDTHTTQNGQDDQYVQNDQNVHDDQTDKDEQIARAVQADLDAQAARDATGIDPDQPGNLPDWDEDDDAAMQQALVLSRQHTQSQGSDPQAASSTGAGQSTEQELNHELQVGIEYQTEVQNLQMKMTQGILHPDDVARYRTVSKLWGDNQARVAELFDRQVQENLNKQSQSTQAILGSLKPLNISRAKAPAKPPPSSKDSTGASTTPAPGKQGGVTNVRKAPPPISGSGKPVAVKTLPQGPPVGPPKGSNPGARSVPIQGGLPAPASPKGSSQSHLTGKTVSPRGNPPPKVLRRPSGPSSIGDGQTPRSVASEATAVLEEKLRKKKEAKRTRQDEEAEVSRDDRDRHKQQRSHRHQQEHRRTRDTRRRNRTPSKRSSSSDTSDDDQRSPSSRDSRSRRREQPRHHRSRSHRDSRSQRRRRSSSDEMKRSRSKRRQGEHRSSKDKRRRDSSSSSQQQEAERHEEDRNKSNSSQPAQAKAAESKNPPPLPPPDNAPTTASSASTQQSQAGQAPQAVAQPVQGQVAQAVPVIIQATPVSSTAVSQLPVAKAVPLRQSQGQGQVAAQPDPKAMPARHIQGQLPVAQPLPQPLYPPQQQLPAVQQRPQLQQMAAPQQQLPAVQQRPQLQQMAAPPGLGTTQQLTQAAHIQHLEQQLAALHSQLRATQPQAQSRHSSHSPEGWNWDDQSQGSQWHGHGWYNWGNGRGYQ